MLRLDFRHFRRSGGGTIAGRSRGAAARGRRAATRRRWDALPITISGRRVSPLVFSLTARWYHALRDQPVRIVPVRDPGGRRRDEAFFCTDLRVGPAFILEGYARRWTPEVSFHDQKQSLGFEDPPNQTSRAVARTAPLASIAYDLVLLRYAAQAEQGGTGVAGPPRYRAKTALSFLDMLIAVRQGSWRLDIPAPPCPPRCPHNSPLSTSDALPAAA